MVSRASRGIGVEAGEVQGFRVHGWDRMKNFNLYLSNHKNVKCYPAMAKV